MTLFQKIKQFGAFQLKTVKEIYMGDKDSSDICEFVDSRYLRIDENGDVFIKSGLSVQGKKASNGWLEITFDNLSSSCDIAFDNEDDYDLHFATM